MKMVGFFTTISQFFDCEGWNDRGVKSSNSFNLKMNSNIILRITTRLRDKNIENDL